MEGSSSLHRDFTWTKIRTIQSLVRTIPCGSATDRLRSRKHEPHWRETVPTLAQCIEKENHILVGPHSPPGVHSLLELSRLLSRLKLALTHCLYYASGAEQTAPVLFPTWQPVPPAAGILGNQLHPAPQMMTAVSCILATIPLWSRMSTAQHGPAVMAP